MAKKKTEAQKKREEAKKKREAEKKRKQEEKLKAAREKEDKRKKIAKTYVDVVKKVRKFPTRVDMLDEGITRDTVRHHFGNMLKLRETAKLLFPEAFKGVVEIEDYVSTEALKELKSKIKKNNRFVITTAVNGQFAHTGFLKALKNYCKKNNAQLLILPSHDPAHNLDNEIEWHFANEITDQDVPIVFDEIDLNSNLHISGVRVNAKQINPTTGLGRISQGKGSFIFASPKQSLEYVPTSNVKMPHALMSTGSCTLPNYKTSLGNSLRTAYLAEYDHVVGGVVVEIEDDTIYHFRQIQADSKGHFIDLGVKYTHKGTSKVKGVKLAMGDYHAGEQDESAVSAWEELCKEVKVDEIVLHDMFNGMSISHHEENNIILRAQRAEKDLLSLEKELKVTSEQIDRVAGWKGIKRVTLAKSNHDEFLLRWLQDSRFSKDPKNFALGCELAAAAVHGADPLRVGLKMVRPMKHDKKLLWLRRDEDYKFANIEIGAHGDKGPNGSRGSIKNLEKAYGSAVIGHSHTPGILRGIFQVGTTSKLQLGYNIGPSSWVHCSCLIYPNGQRQLINSINGKWRL